MIDYTTVANLNFNERVIRWKNAQGAKENKFFAKQIIQTFKATSFKTYRKY